MKITVLGSGLVGLPMALDLKQNPDFDVAVCDVDDRKLFAIKQKHGIKTLKADLSNKSTIRKVVDGCDLVINAVPGYMGYKTLKTIIEAGKNVVDIAFFPENMLDLDALAKEKGVVVVSDIGVAPGMSNLLSAYAYHRFDETTAIRIYVGGLPKVRQWPWEYKAVFSPVDVLEEYTRPARFIRGGKMVTMPALTEPEFLDFQGIGTLEAFNSDGLRSLMYTLDCPEMIEKTLRYPGHIEKIKVLRDTGFLGEEEVDIQGKKVRPIDVTARMLFPKWEFKEGDEDVTVMRIEVEGVKDGKASMLSFSLYDEFDKATGIHSMARTTGYTATGVANMIADGLYTETGVTAPEFIGKDEKCVKYLLNYLSDRGIHYIEKEEPIG